MVCKMCVKYACLQDDVVFLTKLQADPFFEWVLR
jgi:hypothetical protein